MSIDNQIEKEIQAKGKTAQRVTPSDIEANIDQEYYLVPGRSLAMEGRAIPRQSPLNVLTICVLVLRNGFTVTGESSCASIENYDAEIGQKIARSNAVQKIWPLMGYALKDHLRTSE